MSNHKPDGERRETWLQVRVNATEKSAWNHAAHKRAKQQPKRDERGALAGWVRDTLNEKANHQPNKE